MTAAKGGKKITIIPVQDEFIVGEPVSVTVIYSNEGKKAVSFRDPVKTWEVMLYIDSLAPGGTEEELVTQHRLPFGKIIKKTGEFGLSYETREEAETITLKPGAEYRFQYDISYEAISIFGPGRYSLYVVDESKSTAIRSNKELVPVYFKRESVNLLVEMLTKEEAVYDTDSFSIGWLKKIHPALLVEPGDLAEQGAESRQKLSRIFRSWWDRNKNIKQVLQAIRNINNEGHGSKEQGTGEKAQGGVK
ncbi:MAG: hypothetical protein GY754_18285 [bacterium]|nr:hypothetical protein [bacterium]